MTNICSQQWTNINNELNAKIISELHYEEVIFPEQLDTNNWSWEVDGITWIFVAQQHIWHNIIVDPSTMTRNGVANIPSAMLIKDIANAIKLDGIILGNLIEEIQQTLYADLISHQHRNSYSLSQLTALSGIALQSVLKGHPKAIANKGRLGWGVNELARYAPEAAKSFQLHYVAINKSMTQTGIELPVSSNSSMSSDQVNPQALLLAQLMPIEDKNQLIENLTQQGINPEEYWIIPVHPWQFSQFIVPQFTALLASKDIIDLGVTGDIYQAQQSIRTLSNITSPTKNDIKLPITILNTSCYRGIPGKYITSGALLSKTINQLCQEDTFLTQSNLQVLQEWAGIHVPQPLQEDVINTPYRYNEMLGVIFRQSPAALLQSGQQDKLAAALMQTDNQGNSLIATYIKDSQLDVQTWLTKLFDCTVIPLYHLMCQYGIALVSHGQNLTIIFENNIPTGLAIKDFHGDLRLIDQEFDELAIFPTHIKQALTRLPANYLLHDLYTGHFVTVLRFVSPYLQAEMGYSERDFYQLINTRIRHYQGQFPNLKSRFKLFDLLAPTMERICINRVRFKVGYQDTSERLLPELGTAIDNPLFSDQAPLNDI
ncbi:IucA/IucC family protein [Moritella dasanensis]|uniref:IucA/IucC family protein n=1 Tax=Moritella dasanensis TaxID=428031 RepID=UPI00031A5488|nr:IucA/IucC family protein [Moritella dasanensis]